MWVRKPFPVSFIVSAVTCAAETLETKDTKEGDFAGVAGLVFLGLRRRSS